MTLHLHLPHRGSDQQHELREARRLLRERIRTDWEYPTLPAYRSCGQRGPETEEDVADTIAGFRFHMPGGQSIDGCGTGRHDALGREVDPVEWREREYSDVDVSDTETEEPSTTARPLHSKRSEYRFDGPDSVGPQLDGKRQARKRKRLRALHTEMEWNDGLAHWTRRRDVWCSARKATELQLQRDASEKGHGDSDDDFASGTDSTPSRPSTALSSNPDPDPSSTTPASSPSSITPDFAHGVSPTPSVDVLVPIAPPLLPNHPIRRRINHKTYPEIYSKIILQSRSPSIPINLRTLIHALVQGWKDDGEWPPKTGPIEKSIGRKKGTREGNLEEQMRAIGRQLYEMK